MHKNFEIKLSSPVLKYIQNSVFAYIHGGDRLMCGLGRAHAVLCITGWTVFLKIDNYNRSNHKHTYKTYRIHEIKLFPL